MASASEYFSMLRPHCARVDVWRTTYRHQLRDGAAGVVEWFKGSGLIPFLSPLTEEERAQYLQRYLAAVAEAYPALADGSVLLPFPRMFIVATR
jgi:trans-aconitate 2-methyltransferase